MSKDIIGYLSWSVIDAICLHCCEEDRCKRYPSSSESCERFAPMLKAYQAGQAEESTQSYHAGLVDGEARGVMKVVEWIRNHGGCLDGHLKEWQAFLKEHLTEEQLKELKL